MYLSSGAVMDGLVFSPWQVDGNRHSKHIKQLSFNDQNKHKEKCLVFRTLLMLMLFKEAEHTL